MDQIDALPGLSQEESAKLLFSAANGFNFDDEMRGCVVRMIGAIQHPPEPQTVVDAAKAVIKSMAPEPAKVTARKRTRK